VANINVCVVGVPGYGKTIGKKGTESDIIFYNLKRGTDTVTMLEPGRYPERLAPLYYTASMADIALLIVPEISPEFGECVVMLDALGIKAGYIVLQNYLDPSQVEPLTKGTTLEGFTFIDDDPVQIREQLLADAIGWDHGTPVPDNGVVALDHAFNVKGIGTVILGGMISGTIRQHETVRILPGEKTAQIRSIQKHDDDTVEAWEGDRVGLALKNITADDLERGQVLTTSESLVIGTTIQGPVKLGRFWRMPLKEGMVLHIGHWMQFVNGRISEVSERADGAQTIVVECEKDLVYMPGDTAVLHYLDAGKLRVAGTITIE